MPMSVVASLATSSIMTLALTLTSTGLLPSVQAFSVPTTLSQHRIRPSPLLHVTPSTSTTQQVVLSRISSKAPSSRSSTTRLLTIAADDNDSATASVSSSSSSRLFSSAASTSLLSSTKTRAIGSIHATFVRLGMFLFIASMCVALPLTLLPQQPLYRLGLISKIRQERWALATGQFCARWLLRLIPFCRVECITPPNSNSDEEPKPSIWVCNHTSALDVFILLAKDLELRGPKKRPLKIVYWQQLESNPVTKLLFRQCGFIPVRMTANGAGEDNEYDVSSFKSLLKQAKQAFVDGFDLGLLPEGQLNPNPQTGLLPAFPGAFTLAKLSKRPIQFMTLHGISNMWHPDPNVAFKVLDNRVRMRIYPAPVISTETNNDNELTKKKRNKTGCQYSSGDQFMEAFEHVVGTFGTTGADLPSKTQLADYLNGNVQPKNPRNKKAK